MMSIKPVFVGTFLILFSVGVFAQTDISNQPSAMEEVSTSETSPYFPQAGDFGVLLNVNGLINAINLNTPASVLGNNSLVLRYTKSPQVTYRLGLAPSIYRNRARSTDSINTTLVEFDSTASRSQFSIQPGVEFHLKGTKRLDPYAVLQADFGLIGRMNINSITDVTDTTGTSRTLRTITEDGGYAIGGGIRLGANYFLSQNFFLGLEYGIGANALISGGDRQEVIQVEPVSGSNTTTRVLSSARNSGVDFGVGQAVQITIGYFFRFK
jgi:hypothetical protein